MRTRVSQELADLKELQAPLPYSARRPWRACAADIAHVAIGRGANRGPFGVLGSTRSARKVPQSPRSTSQATKYQQPRRCTSRFGSTVRFRSTPPTSVRVQDQSTAV